MLPVIAALAELTKAPDVRLISALNGDEVDGLVRRFAELIPEHPPLYPQDEWARVSERFLVSETIREKIFHLTEQEIPYSTFVDIETFDESDRHQKPCADLCSHHRRTWSQKGIIIGKGERCQPSAPWPRIQKLLDSRVYLELFVKVESDWTKSKKGLKKVGFERS